MPTTAAPAVRAPGSLMLAEIREQPTVLTRQLDTQLAAIREVAARVRAAQPTAVMLAARGTSDHAALYAKYLVETTLGLPCGLASMSAFTAYDAPARYGDVLWIAISQSGSSPDLVQSTEHAARGGALTLAITNTPGSPLASAAHLTIDLAAGVEHAVAATKTYTASLQALWLLVDLWSGGDGSAARGLADQVAWVIERDDALAVASRYRFATRLVSVGRGFSYPTAREGALKLMETVYVGAQAFSGADLLHGPVAMVDVACPAFVVDAGGPASRLLAPVVDRLRRNEADVCLVGPRSVQADGPGLLTPDGLDERLAPIVQIVPLQLVARQMSVERGQDPDRPRGLSKETSTR
jgi:glucosamine--fructose-6-phosphate aminotransferase (isomerizing)